jgi:hypothetical protein
VYAEETKEKKAPDAEETSHDEETKEEREVPYANDVKPMMAVTRKYIVGLFCYICISYYLYVDSLMPLAALHFCVGLDYVTPYGCNLFKVNIIITEIGNFETAQSVFTFILNKEAINTYPPNL